MHPLYKLGNANTIANYLGNYQTFIEKGTAAMELLATLT
jgi:hypothetical protein